MGRRHRAVCKGGIPSLKYGPLPSPLPSSFSLILTGALKMLDVKMQDVKQTDGVAGHEIAGHENTGHENARHRVACTSDVDVIGANSRSM